MRAKKTKKSTRYGNLLDLFLIFLAILCVLGAAFRIRSLRQTQDLEAMQAHFLRIECRGCDPRIAECLQSGDRLYDLSGEYFGEVFRTEIAPAVVTREHEGQMIQGEWEITHLCDMAVEVRVLGRIDNGIFLQGGRRSMVIGTDLRLYSELVEIHGVLHKMFRNEPMTV